MTSAVITAKGQLVDGVPHEGVMHVDFEIRAATVEDQLAAIEAVAAESTDQDVDKGVRAARERVAMLASQLVSLGSIPTDELTYANLRRRLSPDDVDVLFDKAEEARKNWRALPKGDATSSSSPPPSGNAPE